MREGGGSEKKRKRGRERQYIHICRERANQLLTPVFSLLFIPIAYMYSGGSLCVFFFFCVLKKKKVENIL